MATYEVEIPGQGKFRVESPKELTQDQAYFAASQKADMMRMADPTSGMSTYDKVAAGAGKAVTDLWRGAKQLLSKDTPTLSGLVTGDRRSAVQQEIDESRELDAPLMKTTAGKVGHVAGNVAAAVPTMFIPGVNTYTGATLAGGGLGALQPTSGGESRLLNTGLGAAGGVVGQKVANVVGNWAGARLADRGNALASEQSKNIVRDATLGEAKTAGYVLPPTSVKPTAVGSVLEGISGKIKTQQGASIKNQEVTNRLAREAIGLPPDEPLTKAALQSVRDQAGQAYQVVEGLQAVNWDRPFEAGVKSLAQNQSSGAVKNPANKEITELVDGLLQKAQWSGRELVDDIKLLREMGHTNKTAASRAGGDTAKSSLGRAQLKASALLEDLAERNLKNNKAPADAIQALKESRQLIAKTYSVEKALIEGRGNVNASVLAAELKKGKPLNSQLELIARTGQSFPKATQTPESIGSVNPFSALDAWGGSLLGTGTALATGNPVGLLAAAAPVMRPAARAAILSKTYQKSAVNVPSYRPGLLYTAPDALAWNPLVRRSLPPAAAMGLLGYTPE